MNLDLRRNMHRIKSVSVAARALLCACGFAFVPGAWFATALESQNRSTPPARDSLIFRNGDLLFGALDSIDPKQGIFWRHSDVGDLIEFKPDNIAEIQFSQRSAAIRGAGELARLQLHSGDELEGSIATFNNEEVILETWYAGQIAIPRDWVKLIVPVPPEGSTVFHGLTGLDGWTVGAVSAVGDAGQWHYRNGAFYATNAASIARDLNLPEVAIIEFDLAWQGLLNLAIALYTDYLQPINLGNKEAEPDFCGFYSLQLNSFSANVVVVKKDDPLRYLGQVSVPGFNQKNNARIQLRASKPNRSVSLLVDGKLVKQWIDTEGFAGEGTCIRLVNQHQQGQPSRIRLSNLHVAEWDGQFEDTPPAQFSHKQDLAKLRNGDRVSGHVETVKDGKLVISMEKSRLEIPINRVTQIEMAASNLDPVAPGNNSIRAFFRRGGAVTFQLERWENDKVLGMSPSLGQLAFDPAAFSRVEVDLKSPEQ
jgi:hypothetical protein